jgi:hypothetical protein
LIHADWNRRKDRKGSKIAKKKVVVVLPRATVRGEGRGLLCDLWFFAIFASSPERFSTRIALHIRPALR